MKNLASKIESGDFIVTSEYLPGALSEKALPDAVLSMKQATAVNVADNPFGVVMSSLAASGALISSGIEPVYQVVTRDRNRIAIQSDLLGAASMGISNVLCLSGYHQTLTSCSESASVYDLDSTQLIAAVTNMNNNGELIDGTKIAGGFSMTPGAVANPFMRPLELNILRVAGKVNAGARFIQTQAVFEVDAFKEWIDAARVEGITSKAAIIAGVLPLDSADEAIELNEKYTDFTIPGPVIERLQAAGEGDAQKQEGIAIAVEMIKELKSIDGVRGIHIISGGKEACVPEVMTAAELS